MSIDQMPRSRGDRVAANLCLLYLLIILLVFGWLIFDVWIDAHTLPRLFRYPLEPLKTPFYHLIIYTIIGGAMGGIVNGIRSALHYYGDFQQRYSWKYIFAPWLGTALALIGFALLRSTVAIFGGDAASPVADTTESLANFAIGALAGYGSRDVFIWLDEKVAKLFAVEKKTPALTGELAPVATEKIHAANLAVGEVVTAQAETPEDEGKVLDQSPEAGARIESGQSVSMVVGAESNGGKPVANGKKPGSNRKARKE